MTAAVCLDMDGTLVDSERLWDVAVYELAEHMGRPLDERTRRRTLGASLEGFFAVLGEYTGHPVDDAEFRRLSTRLHDRITELMSTDLTWRPGAEELLDELGRAGVPLALVTNTVASVARLPIDFLGRERFDVVVTGDMPERSKPHPDPYLLACDELGCAPGRAVAIEDSVTGASSAVAAGCRVLYVPSGRDQPDVPGAVRHDTLVGVGPAELDRLTASEPAGGAV